MKYKWIFFLLFGFQSNLICQSLSQNSNYYLYHSSNNQFFIGSLDGLNVYNGRENKIFRPSSYSMLGANIQSEFYEDLRGQVWFTTYEALHAYDPEKDKLIYNQFVDLNNDLIDVDYRIIHQSRDTLWVQAGELTILYDSKNNSVIEKLCTDLSNFHTFYVQKNAYGYYQICAGNARGAGIEILTFDKNFQRISTDNFGELSIYGLSKIDKCKLIATTFSGEALIIDHCKRKIISRKKIADSGIHKIEKTEDNNFIFYSIKSGIFKYDIILENKLETLFDPSQYDLSDKSIVEYQPLHNDFILASVVGDGIIPINLNKSKTFDSDLDQAFIQESILKCMLISHDEIIVTSAYKGNYIFDLHSLNRQKIKLTDDSNPIDALTQYNGKVIFSNDDNLYSLDSNHNIQKLKVLSNSNFSSINKLIVIGGRLLGLSNYKLVELIIEKGICLTNKNVLKKIDTQNVTSICQLNRYEGLLSVNDEYILKFSAKDNFTIISDPILIKGNLKDAYTLNSRDTYIATTSGLYRFENQTNKPKLIMGEDSVLNQTIYAIKSDNSGNLWLSSNSGIFKYTPDTRHIHKFGLKDDLQGLEYNTGAHLQTEDGHILFGGMHGLDYFHPDSITLSDYKSPIYFSSLLVNEEPYPHQTAQTLDAITLPYEQNTLTFGFHAIDYTDPKNTLTKYKLVGKDNEFSKETSADGTARYSNLDPGEYTFTVMGANSDHVWNPTPRTLHITILPPWYATWWARSLGILFISGLIYLTFRGYYKRQLREKDLALREANLTISQQKALSEERTRIAAEMHDDLGGGLTTIRFLSQKVMRTVTNESLKTQVTKIVNLSEGLVKNMSEIIWAMDAGYDSMSSLISYTRRYAHEYLEDYDIHLSFKVEGGKTGGIPLSGHQRRNIFLVVKESIHNTIKHANASELLILFKIDKDLIINIKDNGVGLKADTTGGNGLKNMRKRVEALGGNIKFLKEDGLNIEITIPIL